MNDKFWLYAQIGFNICSAFTIYSILMCLKHILAWNKAQNIVIAVLVKQLSPSATGTTEEKK